MESLAPPLQCLIEIKSHLENGESTHFAIKKYLANNKDEFSERLSL